MHTKKNLRRFKQLKRTDRDELQILRGRGYVPSEIALVLGVHRSTISRELRRRKKHGVYDAAIAEQKARVKRLHSKYQGMKVEALSNGERERIISELSLHRAPDEIAGRMKLEAGSAVIGKDAIYRWLYSAWGNKYARYLCTRRLKKRTRAKRTRREMIPNRIPVSARPLEGVHAEGDLFVSPHRCETPVSGALVAEHASKFLWGQMLPNRKPAVMASAMYAMTHTLVLDTLTMDNGIENKHHGAFGIPTFFCDPQSPWQKPLIEQSIGLLRRWFIPKRTDLRTVSETTLQEYLAVLNGKYRKSLGYRSAYEVAMERGILKTKIPDVVRGYQPNCVVAFEVRI